MCALSWTQRNSRLTSPRGVRGITQPSLEIPIRHNVMNKPKQFALRAKWMTLMGEEHQGFRGSYEWRQFQNWVTPGNLHDHPSPHCTGSSQLSCLLNSLFSEAQIGSEQYSFEQSIPGSCSEQSEEFPGKYCFSFTQSLNWECFKALKKHKWWEWEGLDTLEEPEENKMIKDWRQKPQVSFHGQIFTEIL